MSGGDEGCGDRAEGRPSRCAVARGKGIPKDWKSLRIGFYRGYAPAKTNPVGGASFCAPGQIRVSIIEYRVFSIQRKLNMVTPAAGSVHLGRPSSWYGILNGH